MDHRGGAGSDSRDLRRLRDPQNVISGEPPSLTQQTELSGESVGSAGSRWSTLLGGLAVLAIVFVLCEARLWRPDHRFGIRENVQIAEAQAWWDGRLDLPERRWDTALKDGRVYSHFPPMFSFISAAVVPLFDGVPHWLVVLLVLFPTPLLAYTLFRKRAGSPVWGALLAIGFVCGTSAWPVIDKTLRGATPYVLNPTLATIGLLILLAELCGRRRLLVAGIGWLIAVFSRQLTMAYVIPLAWIAWSYGGADKRRRRLAGLAMIVAIAVAVPCTLSTLKYGSPLDTGYMHMYAGRYEDAFARDARTYGLFSAHYVPRNLYYANLGFPERHKVEVAGERQVYLRPNHMGTGIWWTTPLLIWLLVGFRRIWADPLNRAWLAAAAVTFTGLMFYQGTGYDQRGYNRFSLDYLPVLLALVVPHCVSGWRRWVTVAMIVWGVAYFRFVLPIPYVRIG